MAKAMRMMGENLNLCDGVVFVLDARAPASSFNARIVDMVGGKPVLYLLNKADLADAKADMLLAKLRSVRRAIAVSSLSPSSVRPVREAMEELVREKAERNREKGTTRTFRFLVAGIPNTGKSTLINLLAGGRRAEVGDRAGVTRTGQWVKCGDFALFDTPGVMPPACENQTMARRLAYLGCLNDDILALDEIALSLLSDMAEAYPSALAERYGVSEGTPLELLDAVCGRRGFVRKGGEFDYERGERALLDDLRKGKLGKVCFDCADDLKEAGLI